MSRIATTYLALGTWGLAENPGAGTQDLTAVGTGLNDNWKIIDLAVGLQHNANGTHKTDVIDGPMLKTTVADGVMIALTGSPLKLGLVNASITVAKMSVAGATSGQAIIYNGSIVTWGSPTPTLANDSVTAAIISHDNNRTKFFIVFTFAATTNGTYASQGGVLTTVNLGVIMPRAGSITKMTCCNSSGTVTQQAFVYGNKTFAVHDRITLRMVADGEEDIVKNGTPMGITPVGVITSVSMWVLEIEFDD